MKTRKQHLGKLLDLHDSVPNHKRKQKQNLFSDNPRGHPRLRTLGYGTRKKALNSVKKLKHMDKAYQRQAATTMYYRAKYHKYRTDDMEKAMKVYKRFLNSL